MNLFIQCTKAATPTDVFHGVVQVCLVEGPDFFCRDDVDLVAVFRFQVAGLFGPVLPLHVSERDALPFVVALHCTTLKQIQSGKNHTNHTKTASAVKIPHLQALD